tara:strand:- start:188 stop:475 length:288 start_codon:yes stop_codon:yes gene_type:complete
MSQMKRDEARIMNAAKGRLPNLSYLTTVFGKKYGQDQLDRVTDRIMAIPLPGEFGFHLDKGRGKKAGGKITKLSEGKKVRGVGIAKKGVRKCKMR